MIITNAWAAAAETTSGKVAATGEAAHVTAEKEAFPPFDPATFASQLLWLAVTFGIFYLLMSRVAIPRISSILEVRSDRISQDLDEAQRLKEESEAAQQAYEHELAQARGRAHAIAAEANEAAKAAADAEQRKLEAELADRLAQAEAQIAKVRAKAMDAVDDIASGAAEAIVRQLLGGTVAKAELNAAVSGAMDGR